MSFWLALIFCTGACMAAFTLGAYVEKHLTRRAFLQMLRRIAKADGTIDAQEFVEGVADIL